MIGSQEPSMSRGLYECNPLKDMNQVANYIKVYVLCIKLKTALTTDSQIETTPNACEDIYTKCVT